MSDKYQIVEVNPEWTVWPDELGSKKKFWYQPIEDPGSLWLFKYPHGGAGQHWAEKISAEVASLLQIPHATVELATYKGSYGSIAQSLFFIAVSLRSHAAPAVPVRCDWPQLGSGSHPDQALARMQSHQLYVASLEPSCPAGETTGRMERSGTSAGRNRTCDEGSRPRHPAASGTNRFPIRMRQPASVVRRGLTRCPSGAHDSVGRSTVTVASNTPSCGRLDLRSSDSAPLLPERPGLAVPPGLTGQAGHHGAPT